MLREKYDAFLLKSGPTKAAAGNQRPTDTKADERDRWQRDALQQFLGIYFLAYQHPQTFASLWTLLLQYRTEEPHMHLDLSKKKRSGDEDSNERVDITFEILKKTLKHHVNDRLLVKDPFPLDQERFLDATHCKRKDGQEDELELPRLQTAVAKRSSLPLSTRSLPTQGGKHSAAATTSSDSSKDTSDSNTPVLQDFHAEVMKKSRNWLGRWQTRYLFLRWNELEICKKNVSAHRPGPVHAFPSQPASSTGSSSGASGSSSSAATNAAKSKRYPLQSLLTLQIVQLNESDPSKKQALSLHFKQPTANGGNTTKSLILGCDSSDHLKTVVIQIATFAMFYGLANGQDVPSLHKFIQVGANLDVYCLVPSPNVPPFALSPLQLALLQSNEWKPQSFEATVQLLVRSGADPRSLLHWQFATQVLFSSAYGSDHEMLARRLLMIRESIDGVVFPFGGVIADDEQQWNLLMYFCCYGDLEGARQLLTTFSKISKSKCLKYVDHVNAAGDNALHITIKTSRNHASAEDLAMLLVDIGTGNANIITRAASAASGETTTTTSVVPSLTSSSSYIDSQLIHCCNGDGETVFHLALKARLWRLVDKFIDCKAIDPTSCDRHGNTSLHLAIKVEAPVHTIARIIQLYRPNRSSAFNSVSTERSQLVTTLGYECRERRGNDTPLTLAIKYRQQEVVELLLSAGATANVGDCLWSIATTPADPSVNGAQILSTDIGDADSPLHVAIKAGLHRAAVALVAYGANLLSVDSNGASPLALAVRYGMYELSVKIAEKMADVDGSSSREREQKQWLDLETGAPVCVLAIKAGQIELAAVLLDISNNQVSLSHLVTKETLLHILVKNISWLELSGGDTDKSDDDVREKEGQESDRLVVSREASPATRKRSRLKSRSDGDLRHLRLSCLDANPSSQNSPQTLTKPAAASSSDDNPDSVRILERIDFYQHAEEALILGILQRSDDCSIVVASSKYQHAQTRSSFHLPTSPSLVLTDHNVDSYTPLHVAAAGGDATSSALCLFLAYLHVKSSQSRLEMVQILAKTTGSNAESPLHAALASNSAYNGLQILCSLQLARGKREMLTPASDRSRMARPADSLQEKKRINAVCSQMVEAVTVPHGSTPLHLACRWPLNADMLHVVDLLFQEDVYAGCWDSEGSTPLHVGVYSHCDERLIQLFHRYHQDLNVWTEGKARSRIVRSSSAFGSDSEPPRTSDNIVERRPDPARNSGVSSGCESIGNGEQHSPAKTPLMLGIECENVAAFRELVRCGAQLKVVTPKTRLGLLHFAAQQKLQSKELLLYLLECNKLVGYDVTDTFGHTTADAVKALQEQLKVVKDPAPLPHPVFASSPSSYSTKRKTSVVLEETESEISGVSGPTINRSHQTRLHATPSTNADTTGARSGSSNQMVFHIPEQSADLGGSAAENTVSATHLDPSQSISISYSPPPPPPNEQSSVNQGQAPRFAEVQSRDMHVRALPSSTSTLNGRGQSAGAASRLPPASFFGGDSKAPSAPSSPPRSSHPGTARYLQSLPKVPGLDSSIIEYLREEERATLTLVAHEARQEAKDWLKKRIGQKKLLSDARAQLQSAQKHRRTGSGSIPYPKPLDTDSTENHAVPALSFGQENERLLEQYKALAAKKFIDKHVAEAVTEARMEIKREKQAIFQETGLYPGLTSTKHSTASGASSTRRDVLHRTASTNSSMLLSSSQLRSESNATLLSDESTGVWWSERGGSSFFGDDGGNHTWLSASGRGGTMLSDSWNSTWLSSTRGTGIEYRDPLLSSTFQSFLESEYNDPIGVDGIPGVTFVNESGRDAGDDDRGIDDESEDEYMNPLDRNSFSHVIEARNSLL